ncbi:oxidative damage protection protein [Pantoea sp. Aalb]|uniref:oxidative damage protection protein n=1 Tax=Pantoea sp. Aalb TaxID=2576762 RepID=UPI0013276AA5|nr:oxidative damage protection protein [Pantoea sp. Aalb]MXP67715.1 oxidative damage protection protein [Pantoea sp. Aalb]
MGRIIFCTYLQRHAEGQDFCLYQGELGKRIYNEISKEAWQEWLVKQTMIINEQKLNLIHHKDRKIIESEMLVFLFKEKNISV